MDTKDKDKEELTKFFADAFNEVVIPVLEKLPTKEDYEELKEGLGRVEHRLDKIDDRLDRHGKMLDNHDEKISELKNTSANLH